MSAASMQLLQNVWPHGTMEASRKRSKHTGQVRLEGASSDTTANEEAAFNRESRLPPPPDDLGAGGGGAGAPPAWPAPCAWVLAPPCGPGGAAEGGAVAWEEAEATAAERRREDMLGPGKSKVFRSSWCVWVAVPCWLFCSSCGGPWTLALPYS